MATHSSILAWRIPWTEESGGLYSPWGHKDSDTTEQLTHTHTHTHTQSLSGPKNILSSSLSFQKSWKKQAKKEKRKIHHFASYVLLLVMGKTRPIH